MKIIVTLVKITECPSTRWHLERTVRLPNQAATVLHSGLVLSEFTARPCVDLTVDKVILQESGKICLLCEESAPLKDIPRSWFEEAYGPEWKISTVSKV